ncbi:MAG TPA: cytosine permease [bacterium]|nr:cytosine permease [bacterium]
MTKDLDYGVVPVPLTDRRDLYSTATVYAGYAATVYLFFVGAVLGTSFTMCDAILAIVLGNLLLVVIGTLTGYIGCKQGVSTTVLSRATFGYYGQLLTSFLISLTIPGFVGAYTATVGLTIHEVIPSIPWYIGSLVFLASIVITSFYGFKGLARLSWVAVPVLIGLLLYGISSIGVAGVFSWTPEQPMALLDGISLVFATWITGAVLSGGDIGRFTRSPMDVFLGNLTGWFFLGGFITIISTISAIITGQSDIGKLFISMDLTLPGLLIMYLLMWTTADNNLYSFSLAWVNMDQVVNKGKPRLSREQWVIVGAGGVMAIAALVAKVGILPYVYAFTDIIGVLIPPYGGVLIADYLILGKINMRTESIVSTKRPINYEAFGSLAIGFAMAIFVRVGSPPIQGFLAALLARVFVSRLGRSAIYKKKTDSGA